MSTTPKIITINSHNFDGTINKTWEAKFVSKNNNLLTLVGAFEKEIRHEHLGVIRRGTISHEFYWLNCWFNIFKFLELDGSLRNFYCNINVPPKFENNLLDYIDLDIDVLVWKNFSVEILDTNEFEENCKKFNYSAKIKRQTERSLEKILNLIENRQFPFNI